MEKVCIEDKENLEPGEARTLLSKAVKKGKEIARKNESIKVLREKVQERYKVWQEKSEKISEMLTTPEELEIAGNEARLRIYKSK